MYTSSVSFTPFSCHILQRLKFSRQVCEKSSNVKFRENTLYGSRIVPYGRVDRQTDRRTDERTNKYDEVRIHFSQCCQHAKMATAWSVMQRCSVYIYLYIHTVMNTTILQLVAVYNIQLHVSALYVGHHQVVQRTY